MQDSEVERAGDSRGGFLLQKLQVAGGVSLTRLHRPVHQRRNLDGLDGLCGHAHVGHGLCLAFTDHAGLRLGGLHGDSGAGNRDGGGAGKLLDDGAFRDSADDVAGERLRQDTASLKGFKSRGCAHIWVSNQVLGIEKALTVSVRAQILGAFSRR